MRGTAAILALLAAGCSTLRDWAPPADVLSDVVPVYVDSGFTPAARASVEWAVDDWNYALHGYRTYVIAGVVPHPGADPSLPSGAVTVDAAEYAPSYLPSGTIGWVSNIGGRDVHLTARGRTKGCVLHEFGHVLGAEHEAGTLMDAQPWLSCIDRQTIVRVARVHSWNLSTLRSTCQ